MSDSYTGLTGMRMLSEEEFAKLVPEEDTLYIVKGENSFRLYLGKLPVLYVQSGTIRNIVALSASEYEALKDKDPETEYHIYD